MESTFVWFILNIIIIVFCCASNDCGVNGKKLNKKFTLFQSDEIRHIRDVDVNDVEDLTERDPNLSCSEDSLMNILADAEVISPERLIQMALNDLHGSCKMLASRINILKTYFRKCGIMAGNVFTTAGKNDVDNNGGGGGGTGSAGATLSSRDLYMSLIRGIYALNEKICMDQTFISRMEVYSECIHPVVDDFDACAGPADWNEEEDPEKLCKSYADIVHCYYVRAAKVCGIEAANIIRELIVHVFDSILKPIAREYCSNEVNTLTSVDDVMPKDIALANAEIGNSRGAGGENVRSHCDFLHFRHYLVSITITIILIATVQINI